MIFKKPDLDKKEREKYLADLEKKIFLKEKELESINTASEITRRSLEESLNESANEIRKQIADLDNVLFFKREERVELEKPLTARSKALDEREQKLSIRSQSLDDAVQAVFERERATESKLEGIQDLADTLGETRVRLAVKEKTLQGRENLLRDRESNHLIQVEFFNENVKKSYESARQREYDVSLREMNIESEKENLVKREKQLSDDHIWLNDQRGVLARAWEELRRKSYEHEH